MAKDAPQAAKLEIEGDKGSIEFINPVLPHWGHQITITSGGETRTETIEAGSTFDNQLNHVIDVLAGETEQLTGGEDAIANMAAIDALYAKAGVERIIKP